ncbi:MAG TPA: cysteine desulfurase [Gammaproteobacteria bacterium]|jgi:cysteine desulfurase/selenocysteine lyase|nr:cysteine desulfurase [Gammaproteobacteria bacterium]
MKSETRTTELKWFKKDFPLLGGTNRGKPLVYLDSASSAQKPQQVIDAISYFYGHDYANIHRGIYELSERATNVYEQAREAAARFINASSNEIIFTSGTTGAINLVAQSFGRSQLQAGDEIIVTEMEHHSNIVPWYLLKEQMGIVLKVVPVLDDGSLDMLAYASLFSSRTKLVAVTHVSNVIGTINPIRDMIMLAHSNDVPVLVDGAQAVPHMNVDVADLDCDFYTFSSHKLYGPTGIGVLYAKSHWLSQMPPYQGGGGMIETVSFDEIIYVNAPHKFEAGTPDIAGAVGLLAAIQYISNIGMQNIEKHEQSLLEYAEEKIHELGFVQIIGTTHPKAGVISFVMNDVHAHDIGTILDAEGIAIRAGHHCAMPLMQRFNVPATVRASFGIYNDFSDVDALIEALKLVKRLFPDVAA